MGKIFAALACLSLTGCVAPPIVSYVSMALDGASFITTGKSVGDHMLSVAVNEDCALLRVITEQDIAAVCQEYPLEELGGEQQEAATELTFNDDFKIPRLGVEAEKFPTLAARESEPIEPESPTTFMPASLKTKLFDSLDNQSAVYLMIGNFSSKEGAEKLAAKVTGMNAAVAPAMAGNALYFRVVAGPIAPGETDAAQSHLAATGINNSWAANLCKDNLGAPPCKNP